MACPSFFASMELEKLTRERAVDAVYKVLRQAILGSTLKPGERLHIDQLAVKLGVSLTPVRNAIQQLSTEGLVEIRPRSGTYVASLSVQDVGETFDIRCALECLAAEKAVVNATPNDLKKLKTLLAGLRKSVRTDEDRVQHERDNSELHKTLVSLSGNSRLIEVYESLNAHLKIARIHMGSDSGISRLKDEQVEHEEIYEALEARDSVGVVQAVRKHIMRAKDSLIASLRH